MAYTGWVSFGWDLVVNIEFIYVSDILFPHKLKTILYNTYSANQFCLYPIMWGQNRSFCWWCHDGAPKVSNSAAFWIFDYPVKDVLKWSTQVQVYLGLGICKRSCFLSKPRTVWETQGVFIHRLVSPQPKSLLSDNIQFLCLLINSFGLE